MPCFVQVKDEDRLGNILKTLLTERGEVKEGHTGYFEILRGICGPG